MKITRRDFLKWSSLAAVGAVACNVFDDREMTIQSPLNMPEDLVTGQDNWYATLCQCPEREGVLIRVMEGRAKKVRGNPLYPINLGKQSARCEGGLQSLYHPDRLTGPMMRVGPKGSRQFQQIGWDSAIERLLGQLRELRTANNANAMVMMTEPLRGHLGLVASRFTEAFGGRHLAFETHDQTVLRAAVKRVFDQDMLPNFDIENSRYILSFGNDFLSTWVSPVRYAQGYGEFRSSEGGSERGLHAHADPRYSMTAANADEWLPITPGMEGVLALSIACVIATEDLGDAAMVQTMLGGAGPSVLDDFQPERVVASIGIPEMIRGEAAADFIRRTAREFASHRPSLAIGGGEAAAHTNGLFNLSAIYALNYMVGSVGRNPGQGGISFNPPPPIEGIARAATAGSLRDWVGITDDINAGRVKLLMVRGANPVHGLPNIVGFSEALMNNDQYIVSFSSFMDDTSQVADLILPERIYLEEWGDDIPDPGPGYQVVGMQQPVVNPLSDLDPRSFPDILLSLSQDLQLDDGLPDTFSEVLRQGARQLFELNRGSVQAATFEGFWNTLLQQGGWWDKDSVSTVQPPAPPDLAELAQGLTRPVFTSPSGEKIFYLVPFLSNSLLDGRGAHLPWLQATPDPLTTVTWQTWIEINAHEAKEMGLKEGDIVKVVSTEDSLEAVVYPHPAVPKGVVSIPVGLGQAPGLMYSTREGIQRGANPMSILAPASDTETGALAWAATKVLVQPTTRNIRVSKFEGIVPAFPFGTKEEDIVHVTRG